MSLEPRLGPAAHLDHQAAAGKGEEDLGVNYGVCEEDRAEEVAVVVGGSLKSEFLKQPPVTAELRLRPGGLLADTAAETVQNVLFSPTRFGFRPLLRSRADGYESFPAD